MIVVRKATEIAESTSIEMLLMVSFAVERIARFVRDELLETMGRSSFVMSGREIGTISGST